MALDGHALDIRSSTSSTKGQAAYPVRIRLEGYSGLKGGLAYFSSTILIDLVYSGVTSGEMQMPPR